MWFVTWVGGMVISAAILQAFVALLWCVSAAVTGYNFDGEQKAALHTGMFVISIVAYLFLTLTWFINSAPVGG